MTRRIALAILLTVWAMLIASGVTAYLTTREVLLSDLDQTLVDQVKVLPELVHPDPPTPAPGAVARVGQSASPAGARPVGGRGSVRIRGDGDRYLIQTVTDGRTLDAAADSRSVVESVPVGPGGTAPGDAAPAEVQVVKKTFSTLADGRRGRSVTLRALAKPRQAGGAPVPVLVTYTRSAEPFHRLLDRLAWTLTLCGAAGGLLAAGIAYRVSQSSLRPLRHTADLVGSIDERHLDRRIPADSLPPELLPVAQRLNEMLARLQEAFAQRRQFLADASHELRTPVAALVTGLEVALARPRQAELYRSALTGALADASHLRALVEKLMEQVRSETFTHDEPVTSVDVSVLLDECAAAAAALALDKGIQFTKDYPPGLTIHTQPGRLRSVIGNLLSNAVEYNRQNGTVSVTASRNGHDLELAVRDTGPGIGAEKVPHLFEPFFRGDESHQSDAGHLGLGLFLVKSHLNALNGRCMVESEVGVGTTFRVFVPAGVQGTHDGQDGRENGQANLRTDKVVQVAQRTKAATFKAHLSQMA